MCCGLSFSRQKTTKNNHYFFAMDTETKTTMSDNSQPTLKRALGVSTGVLLVAGMMIGSGVFKKIVPMAQTGLSETWIILAWIGAGSEEEK